VADAEGCPLTVRNPSLAYAPSMVCALVSCWLPADELMLGCVFTCWPPAWPGVDAGARVRISLAITCAACCW